MLIGLLQTVLTSRWHPGGGRAGLQLFTTLHWQRKPETKRL